MGVCTERGVCQRRAKLKVSLGVSLMRLMESYRSDFAAEDLYEFYCTNPRTNMQQCFPLAVSPTAG